LEGKYTMTIASSVKQCLANLKGIEAQLSSLALNSLDPNAKELFHETMLTISSVKKDLQTRVLELEKLEPQYKS
jgi:Protein of unknown function (DUF1657)